MGAKLEHNIPPQRFLTESVLTARKKSDEEEENDAGLH